MNEDKYHELQEKMVSAFQSFRKKRDLALCSPLSIFRHGYEAALQESMEQSANGSVVGGQEQHRQLKAEIATICDILATPCKQEKSWLVVRQCYESAELAATVPPEAGAANNRSDEIAWLESTIAFCKQRFNDRYISIIIDRLNDRIAQLRVVR